MADEREERDTAIERLYGLPLEEFTAARDEAARRLRRRGDGDGGTELKQLRKPTVAAWALNQVRRNNREQSDELIEAGQRLREAHESLLAGGGRESLERAAEDERRLVVELARHAERELVAVGRSVSGAVRDSLRTTLHAVASDAEAREALAAGRLVREHDASGLGPLAESAVPSPAARKRRKEPTATTSAARRRRTRRLEDRLERSRARQLTLDGENADAARRLREARREAARAAAELERAEAAEERTRGRAEEAAEKLAELERELRELAATRGG